MTEPKKSRSYAQHERQHDEFRDGGRYHAMNPCELCGKGVGAKYYTSKWQDEIGKGLVLDKACCTKVDAMTEEQARAAFHLAKKAPAKPSAAKQATPQPPAPTPRMKALADEYEQLHKVVMTSDDSEAVHKAKTRIMAVKAERARLWKEQTAGVDAKIVKVWQKWAKGMG